MGVTMRVTSRRKYRNTEVDAKLREINTRRFGDFFTIEYEGDDSWVVSNKGEHRMWFWVTSTRRKIESGMPHRNWQQWTHTVFLNELGEAFAGRLGADDGTPTWCADGDKYPTFDSYLDMMSLWGSGENGTPSPEVAKAIAAIRAADHKQVPEALRPYAFPGETP